MKTTAPFGEPIQPADAATIERAIKVAIEALREMGVRQEGSIVVGGGLLDESSALAVGADGYRQDMLLAAKAAGSRGAI